MTGFSQQLTFLAPGLPEVAPAAARSYAPLFERRSSRAEGVSSHAAGTVSTFAIAAGAVAGLRRQRAASRALRQRHAALAKKHVAVSDAGPCIQEMDEDGFEQPVEGKIKFVCHHKRGGGFHIRLGDGSGHVDAKFWPPAADVFREHPALQTGAVVRLTGMEACVIKGKELDFSPPGRKHCLSCRDASNVSIDLLQEVAAMELMEALDEPEGTFVDIRSACVIGVEDVEYKTTKDGGEVPLRVVWLAPARESAGCIPWKLWGETAMKYGHEQLDGQRLSIRGAKTSEFGGEVQLIGCSRIGGVHFLPESED